MAVEEVVDDGYGFASGDGDAVVRANVPCSVRGACYYNCRAGAQANPYTRGCSKIVGCRGYSVENLENLEVQLGCSKIEGYSVSLTGASPRRGRRAPRIRRGRPPRRRSRDCGARAVPSPSRPRHLGRPRYHHRGGAVRRRRRRGGWQGET
ncbi:hypothetical protein ACQ4PT_027649 [Festuca glaucescens]